ncbi:MAG: glucose-6-phosphate dehydrogenase assembly protein OpcA [Parachlamydiaceae bacterium]|nr:glucose-6-phosphate dehydrogenase assembly protein OpcA [Parachlamydiaceae bacterium]
MSQALDIQIPDIEKALENLSEFPKDKKHNKACLFTLIIYAHEPKRIKQHQELIDNILDKFPCRIIFIQGEDKSTKYLHVGVANVKSGQEGTTVICDQITIKASQSELARVPYIVIPHIIPDLPVYLLWSQTPFKEHIIFPSLQPYASRIIFDTECSESLHQFSEEMLENMNVLKMDVMDINWALISNWRDMLVQLFDTPTKLSSLQKCKSLKITYNNAKTEMSCCPAIRAIYLQGWLASKLKWGYSNVEKSDNSTIINYDTNDHPSIVTLRSENDEKLPSGAIISIELNTVDGFLINISRNQSLSQAVIHISSQEQCELPYTLPLPDVHQGLTFMKEIFYHKLSDHYLDMLKIISKMDKSVL